MKKILLSILAVSSAILFGALIANASPITQIYGGGTATTTAPAFGSLLVGATSTQYGVLVVGSNGQCPIASSTAPLGISWGACSSATGANPTASVGTSAINGSASTFMRSDGAPAINQAATFAFSALGNTTSTANISASTFNASTSITNQGVKSAIVLNNSSGLEGAYGGNTCGAGFASAISATGVLSCAATSTNPGTVTTSSAGTANTLPIWTSGSALGNSHESESGTSTFINASATYIGTNASSGSFQLSSNATNVKSYVAAGSSTVATTIGGKLGYSATSTGNGAAASTSIETFNIPTSTFLTVGDEVDMFFGGTFASTAATNKQIQIVVASTTIFDTGASFAPANVACNWTVQSRGMATLAIPTTSVATTTIMWVSQFTDSCTSALTDDSGDAGNKVVTATTTSPINITVYGNGTNASDVVANFATYQYAPF